MPKKVDFNSIGEQLQTASQSKTEIPNVQPTAPKKIHLGRKKRLATKRENAVTVYLTDQMKERLADVKYNNRIELQRVVQTALQEFLDQHYSEEMKALNTEGFNRVKRFEHSITEE